MAALAAGVDHGTAYQHRKRDPGFAERWAAALAAAAAGAAAAFCAGGTAARRDRTAGLSGWGGEALVARLSKRHGVQMVREGEGRYSAERGAAFIAALRATGCVKRAAAAAGISTTSFYKRRGRYPGFAAEWAAAEQDAKARLHGFVLAAGIAAFDPDGPGDAETPKVTVSEAIAILRLKGGAAPAPARTAAAGAGGAEEPPIEQVRDDVLRQVAAIRRKAEREGGA